MDNQLNPNAEIKAKECRSQSIESLDNVMIQLISAQPEIPVKSENQTLDFLAKIKVVSDVAAKCRIELAIVLDISGSMNANGQIENAIKSIIEVFVHIYFLNTMIKKKELLYLLCTEYDNFFIIHSTNITFHYFLFFIFFFKNPFHISRN